MEFMPFAPESPSDSTDDFGDATNSRRTTSRISPSTSANDSASSAGVTGLWMFMAISSLRHECLLVGTGTATAATGINTQQHTSRHATLERITARQPRP